MFPVPSHFSPTQPADVRGHGVAAVVIFLGLWRGRTRNQLRLETRQHASNHVSRIRIAGPASQRRIPGLVFPTDDVALRVQPGALVNNEGEPIVLPGHLILARELHAHRFPYRLRQQCGIVAHGISAVQAIASGTPAKDDADILGLQAKNHRRCAAQRPYTLRRRPDGDLVARDIGDGAGAAHRTMHLVRMMVSGLDYRGRARKFFLDVRARRPSWCHEPAFVPAGMS